MRELQLSETDVEIVQERFLDNMLWELKGCAAEQREPFCQFVKTKGLKKMEILSEKGLTNLDFVSQEIAESFCKKSLESRWFENISMTGCRIEKYKTRVMELFDQIAGQGKTCGIWGAGKDGRLLVDFCAENYCQCKGLTDSDKKKWGQTFSGYKIYPPQDLLSIVNTVIVLNQKYFNDIYDQVKAMHRGIEMVSLNMYLQYGQDLRSSTIIVAD